MAWVLPWVFGQPAFHDYQGLDIPLRKLGNKLTCREKFPRIYAGKYAKQKKFQMATYQEVGDEFQSPVVDTTMRSRAPPMSFSNYHLKRILTKGKADSSLLREGISVGGN